MRYGLRKPLRHPNVDAMFQLKCPDSDVQTAKSRQLYLYPLMILYFVNRIAELVEKETEAWYKMDPDPFDDRHPSEHL